jgi:hypothetical protein
MEMGSLAVPDLAKAAVSRDEVKHARKRQDEAMRQEALAAIKQGLVPPLEKMSPALIDNIWLPLEEDLHHQRQHIYHYKHGYPNDSRRSKDEKPYVPDEYTLKYVIPEAERKAAEMEVKCQPYRAEWDRRNGWQRWLRVTNGNGHVHLDTNCSTCFPTTQWGLVPDLSGLNAKEMVEEVGDMACTVCFPWAPATKGWARTAAEREDIKRANQMEKVRKGAEKEAKAIQDVDGGRLRDQSGYPIETLNAAWRELTSAIDWLKEPTYEGNPYIAKYQEFIERAVPAIAKKLGQSPQEVRIEAERKVAERRKREKR